IIALRAIYGRPLRPALIEYTQRYNPLWPRPCEDSQRLDSRLPVAAATPPVEDCSADDDATAAGPAPSATSPAESPHGTTACDLDTPYSVVAAGAEDDASQPLLTERNSLPVTGVRTAPN